MVLIVVGCIALALLLSLIVIAACVYRSWIRKRDGLIKEKLIDAAGNHGSDRERLLRGPEVISPPATLFLDSDQIELQDIISRGRFSVVWKSLYKTTGEYVAVKIYPPTYRQYYCNESRVYSWTCMEHENVVRFYGGAEITAPTSTLDKSEKSVAILNQMASLPLQHQQAFPQYWIVTAYMSQGTLQDFLKANTVDWEEMCRMGASVASGLAYLHGVVACGGMSFLNAFIISVGIRRSRRRIVEMSGMDKIRH